MTGRCDRCGRTGRLDVAGQPGTPCPDYYCQGVLVPSPTSPTSETETDEPDQSNLCLRVLPVPAGMPLRDWAVVRLADMVVVETVDIETRAEARAEYWTQRAPGRFIACPTIIDRSAMPYRARVEVLI